MAPGLGRRHSYLERSGIGHTDVFGGMHYEPARYKARILSRFHHAG